MNLRTYDIIPQLLPYVKLVCILEYGHDRPFRVLPDTCAELFINCDYLPTAGLGYKNEHHRKRSFVVFRMQDFMDVSMVPASRCISVCFHPGAAYHFMPGLQMTAASDIAVDIQDIWRDRVEELEERVALAADDDSKIAIVQQYLLAMLSRSRGDDAALQYCIRRINTHDGQLSVRQLADEAGLSERQLCRRFINHIGISPKEFIKARRFIVAMHHWKNNRDQPFTGLAYESGYYDQAHFIHDCKKYTGLTPGKLAITEHVIC